MSTESQTNSIEKDPLLPLKEHPINSLFQTLSAYLGIERDWFAAAMFLSLIAGRMKMPIHLELVSDQRVLDLMLADRICNLQPDAIANIDTYLQFKRKELCKYKGLYVLIFRSEKNKLFQDGLGYSARECVLGSCSPSIWRIVSEFSHTSENGLILRLISSSDSRGLQNFASSFASRSGDNDSRKILAGAIETLCPQINYPWEFREKVLSNLSDHLPIRMLIVERMLQIFANLRRYLLDFRGEQKITVEDYSAVRTFLLYLPMMPSDSTLSPEAIQTANIIFHYVNEPNYMLALPDRSEEGHQWFTRNNVLEWTDYRYTTVKKYLQQLEDDAVIISTVDSNNRQHGRIIHYRFCSNRAPPFGWKNPFDFLPEI